MIKIRLILRPYAHGATYSKSDYKLFTCLVYLTNLLRLNKRDINKGDYSIA